MIVRTKSASEGCFQIEDHLPTGGGLRNSQAPQRNFVLANIDLPTIPSMHATMEDDAQLRGRTKYEHQAVLYHPV